MFAFATDRVNGLGLTAAGFWGASWRELEARRRVYDGSLRRHAELLAALHNGAVLRKDKKFWIPSMFLEKEEVAEDKPQWQRDLAVMQQAFPAVKKSPGEIAAEKQAVDEHFGARMKRAQEAQRAGADPAKLGRIMRGEE